MKEFAPKADEGWSKQVQRSLSNRDIHCPECKKGL